MSENLEFLFIARLSSEVSLKKFRARKVFVQCLEDNLKASFEKRKIGANIYFARHKFYITTNNKEETISILNHTFGIGTFSPVEKTISSDFESILENGKEVFAEHINGKSFSVRCKKTEGQHPFKSMEVERILGGILKKHGGLVNLSNPKVVAHVEINNKKAYLYFQRVKGPGGFPVASQGKAICLVSGGFDSIVAAWRILKRGVKIDFIFYNLGGKAYERLVLQVVKVFCELWGCHYNPKILITDFSEIATMIKKEIKPSCQQIILKKVMYMIADHFAKLDKYHGIITGEAIAQVSSQTLANLNAINESSDTQVIRPLIGFDKEEIIEQARSIGTAFLSEKIKEYCHISNSYPLTSGNLRTLRIEANKLDKELIAKTISETRMITNNDLNAETLRTPYLSVDSFSSDDVIIDCQAKHMYRHWHVDTALHYDFEDLIKSFNKLDKEKRYILYCTHGTQTPYAAEIMQQSGFEAYAFKGGLKQLQDYYKKHYSK